jgi:two-component system NarL family response regulator
MNAPIRVMCVDDHPMVLEGVSSMIGRQNDMELVAEAQSGETAIAQFRRFRPDITIMDLKLPAMSGVRAIELIRAEWPEARIIVLTMFHGDEDIFRALQAGATTYVLKDARSEELLRIVRQVHAGDRPLPDNVAALLSERSTHPVLTVREIGVLELVSRGLRNKEIGAALGVTEETVKSHVKSILGKLGVNDRTAAIQVAHRRGIIHVD